MRLFPACAIRHCPAQAVTPVASRPALTTNSDGDEDDRRIAESAQRLVQIEHAGEIQRERRAERHEHDRKRSQTNSTTIAMMIANIIQIGSRGRGLRVGFRAASRT